MSIPQHPKLTAQRTQLDRDKLLPEALHAGTWLLVAALQLAASRIGERELTTSATSTGKKHRI